jgi:prepilin-type N-terminal cleavage/methylation domain-containing protein/prepilin-type processing-associated H-X9-DG protein
MNRRAFTLIELLVVIAIIAILAAILFPVFAQAKVSAKGAASISNAKQVGTALLIYSTDYDDFPPIAANGDADAPFLLLGAPYKPWAYLLLPYCRSGRIFQDPLVNVEPVPTGFVDEILYTYRTQIGYAYTIHAPVTTSGANWVRGSTSQTELAKVADTVMLAQKKARNGQGDWLWQLNGVSGPIWGANIAAPPVCGAFMSPLPIQPRSVCPACPSGGLSWGVGCPSYPSQPESEGSVTGGVALRKAGMAIITYADGHVKTASAGFLAQGTNWTRTTPYASVAITDITKYLWDKE